VAAMPWGPAGEDEALDIQRYQKYRSSMGRDGF